MEKKIQELTEKMFRDGVEKGQTEAQRIIAEAKAQAADIVAQAQKDAEQTKAAAQKAAAELDTNTRSELKLYAGMALSALKSEATNLVTDRIVKDAVATATSDKDVMGRFIVALAQNMQDGKPVISTADADNLKAYFAQNAKALLDGGVTIENVNGQKAGFTIAPADGSYKIQFGDAEFEAFFKSFLRPQLIDMLFGK